jgi:diguanylate cyclase (GGDEF)-like protein
MCVQPEPAVLQLPGALVAAATPLDALAVLYEAGCRHGLECWLLAAPDEVWQGYLFSRWPLCGEEVQKHLAEIAAQAAILRPDWEACRPPGGVYPVQVGCQEWQDFCAHWAQWRDFEVLVAQDLVGVVRVGSLADQTAPDWDLAGEMVALAAPYLGYLLSPHASHDAVLLDPLTGLYGEAYFREQLKREVRCAAAYAKPVSLIVLEIVPREEGRLVDGRTLKDVAHLLSLRTRRSDLCARVGPARFALLMPSTGAREAMIVASRLEEALRKEAGLNGSFDVSLGISGWNAYGPDEWELFRQAEEAARTAAACGRPGPFVYA